MRGLIRDKFALSPLPQKKRTLNKRGLNADLSAEVHKAIDSNLPLDSLTFFAKRAAPTTPLPIHTKKLRFFAFRGRASLFPLLAKNRRLHNHKTDFSHHEVGETNGVNARNLDCHDFATSAKSRNGRFGADTHHLSIKLHIDGFNTI